MELRSNLISCLENRYLLFSNSIHCELPLVLYEILFTEWIGIKISGEEITG